ncbi:hypothetical protein ACN4EK_12405 [Pantanalinema rosaneae CENA516]|uniref:hypothetical protein n=1 Tax=Pantanalinema rosaneae TaxID=1620701 RepID=UPI003D6EA9C9
MKLPTQDIDAFNNVDFQKVAEYLQHRNWHEEERIDDRAAIWGYVNQEGKKAEVLLPLTREVPDYASRMDDVFRVLEIIEQRPKAEIFNDLVDVMAIAADKQREILNLHFYFESEDNRTSAVEASAKHLGAILESLQALFDSIGQVKAGRPSPFGKVAKDITDQTRLSVLGTFKGSFGVRLALAPQPQEQQPNLFNQLPPEPLGELVTQEFLEILSQTHEQRLEQLSDRLISLQRRTASNYRKFLLSLLDASTDLRVDWGSLNANRGGTAAVTSADAIATVEAIKKIEADAPQEYQLVSELLAASKSNKTFELRNMENDAPLVGKIADEIISSGEVELTIGKLYNVTVRERISVSPITGEGKIERTLIAIHPWHSDTTVAA